MGSHTGRKRKQGVKRYPGGRIKRSQVYDRGSEGYQRRRELLTAALPTDYKRRVGEAIDAPGRAYAAGLLTDTQRDAIRIFSRAYWCMLPGGYGKTTLAQFVPGARSMKVAEWLHEDDKAVRDKKREDMVVRVRDEQTKLGAHVKRAFDHIALDQHVDDGPAWLDRLLFNQAHDGDHEMMAALRLSLAPLF